MWRTGGDLEAEGESKSKQDLASLGGVPPIVSPMAAMEGVQPNNDAVNVGGDLETEEESKSKQDLASLGHVPSILSPAAAVEDGQPTNDAASAASGDFGADGSSPGGCRAHLFVLVMGVLEVVFSVENAVAESAFKLDNGQDFVYSASATMEAVGLGFMLAMGLYHYLAKEPNWYEEFGPPLLILATHTNDDDKRTLAMAGMRGMAMQAVAVCAVYVVYLWKVSSQWTFVVVLVALGFLALGIFAILWRSVPSGWYSESFALPLVVFVSSILVSYFLLVLGIDVSEIVFLSLGGEPWRVIVIAILDVLVICAGLIPLFAGFVILAAIMCSAMFGRKETARE